MGRVTYCVFTGLCVFNWLKIGMCIYHYHTITSLVLVTIRNKSTQARIVTGIHWSIQNVALDYELQSRKLLILFKSVCRWYLSKAMMSVWGASPVGDEPKH